MGFLQRAWFSVVRRKSKSLILFAVIFILGNVIAGAIAVQQSTSNVEKKVKADLGAVATIGYDFEKITEESQNGTVSMEKPETLSEEKIKQIGKLSYVKEFDYSISGYIALEKFKTISYEDVSEEDMGGYMGPSNVTLSGTNAKEPMDFKDKKVDLIDGRFFEEADLTSKQYIAIISKRVAEENGLSVGDELTLDGQFADYSEDGGMKLTKSSDYSIKVIGIFEPLKLEVKTEDSEKQGGFNDPFFEMTQFNTFYMPNEAIKEINEQEFEFGKKFKPEYYKNVDDTEMTFEDSFYATPTYILKTPEDVEAFKQEAASLIPEAYKITASTDKYDEVAGSMKKLSQISSYVVIIAVIATLVIISLVVILFLRDRKHELGIYLSLGEKRKNVLLQIIIELLLISLVAMCLSLVTGNLLGGVVSDSLLQSDMLQSSSSSSMSDMYDPMSMMNQISLSTEDVQNAYQVEFSLGYMLTFLTAGLFTILGSAILPLLYILRLNPKKIMM